MAKTPSMTVSEAETDVLRLCHARPIKIFSSEARRRVKKYLTARGMPSAFAGKLTYAELADAFNSEQGFQDCMKRVTSEDWNKQDTEDDDYTDAIATDAEVTSPPTITIEPTPTVTPPPKKSTNVEQAIRDLIEATQTKQELDEARVKELIDARIEERGVLRHDVKIVNGDGVTIKQLKGVHKCFPTLLRMMNARQANGLHFNIMLSGPTGSGKTHAVAQAAAALGLEFYSNGAISQDYQLVGFKDANGNYHTTPLREAFGRPAAYLFDEFDSSDNSPMLCIAAVLANHGHNFPDLFVHRHRDSVMLAAGNTWGNGATADFVGRVKVDGAIRSRFPVRLPWDYDESLEDEICGNPTWSHRVQRARSKARVAGLKVIIDPRMSQAGAAMIAAGFTEDEAAAYTYLADMSPDQRKMVESN